METYKVRTDAPNPTATKRTTVFNDGIGSLALQSEDDLFEGTPSRVISNLQVNTDEANMAKAPEYIRAGIKAELEEATKGGRQQLVVSIEDPLASDTYKQLAKEVGAEYKESGNNATLKPGVSQGLDYVGDSFSSAQALSSGYGDEEIREYLSSRGYEQDQTDRVLRHAYSINQAKESGYSDDEIKEFLNGMEVKALDTSSVPLNVEQDPEWKATSLPSEVDDMSMDELYQHLKILSPKSTGAITATLGYLGNSEARAEVAEATAASRKRMIELADEQGVKLQWDEQSGSFWAATDEGLVPVDDGFWEGLKGEKGALAGAVAGAWAGGVAGAPFGPIGAGVGSLIGGVIGTYAGSSFDYLQSSMELQQELELQRMATHSFNNAELDLLFTAGGGIVGKGLKVGSKAFLDGMKRVKDFVIDGNSKGAYEILKKLEFVTDDEATDIVRRLGKISSGPAGTKAEEKAISALAITRPGSEGLMKAVASFDPLASRSVVQGIDNRAKDLLKTTEELSGENAGRKLREDLTNYTDEVKDFYRAVKSVPSEAPGRNRFRFNYEALAIEPALNRLKANIAELGDPALTERFLAQSRRVRGFSSSRSLSDLVELRQIVNEFKYNKRIRNTKDFNMLNDVISNIDKTIEVGAKTTLENPKKWLSDYALARSRYAKMKGLEQNVMYKALTRPGLNEQDIARSLSKYSTALDGTFTDLVKQLPKEAKTKVENTIIDTLANKYTAGVGEGLRATNFPMLAEALNKVSVTTPKARQIKIAINELAEVFKNDVPLSQISGGVRIPTFQSFLTTDPVARAKYEIASSIFNKIKTLIPGQTGDTLALVRKTAKLLDKPLDSKAMKDLMTESSGVVDVSPYIIKMQQQAAKAAAAGKDKSAATIRFYKVGKVLKTKGTGEVTKIPVHRIASTNTMKEISDISGVPFTDKKVLDLELKSRGYKAVQQGSDAVRVLK